MTSLEQLKEEYKQDFINTIGQHIKQAEQQQIFQNGMKFGEYRKAKAIAKTF